MPGTAWEASQGRAGAPSWFTLRPEDEINSINNVDIEGGGRGGRAF